MEVFTSKMKKLLGIVVLGLLWSGNVYAKNLK